MKRHCFLLRFLSGFLFGVFCLVAKEKTKSVDDLTLDREKEGFDVAFEYLNINFSSTSIKNQTPYAKFSNTNFKGISQLIAESSLLFHANYYAKNFVIFNQISSQYGHNILYPTNAPRIDNTTVDGIIFSTDYTQKLWNFERALGGCSLGPYVQFYYETQLFRIPNINRTQILHLGTGWKIFDGKYIKSLYVNFFGEQNLTYVHPVQNLGYNIGLRMQYPFKDNAKLVGMFSFTHYVYNNYPMAFKPQYFLEFKTRLETAIFKYVSVAPFINFYLLKGQFIKHAATNLMLGVSLSYGQTYISAKASKSLKPAMKQEPKKEESKENPKKEEIKKENSKKESQKEQAT
ncbi:Uncharacterised protein [Helicobacter mustelae]|uniref:hypothetical protein n=1 Tax=Helicobacter mustelae TaxID=217 RepID=UPI000E0472CE|nr:hypothetical protein [Helicobacter mustelae]STP12794.1 Uncharacterised protein [Helicobacter mustelae]